ncbi:MAG: hypothetical protein ACYCW6_00235 [Candidatus Xenobia bacterium]
MNLDQNDRHMATAGAVLQVWDNGQHRVIAESADQAVELLKAAVGYDDNFPDGPFRPVPPDKVLTITDEDGRTLRRTLAEWIEERGAGYLCSRDW